MQKIRTNCPLDCFAHCGLVAQVDGNKIVNITGDQQHPLNKGLICNKGRNKHLQRLYSPDRVTTPLRKTEQGWQPITWENAYEIMAQELTKIINLYGPLAILHHDGAGSEGILRNLPQRFFNALGGCSQPEGSICWGSGYQAQHYDFGQPQLHSWSDILNSRLILLWGRDPAVTNLQMMPLLRQAKEKGARIIVINPMEVASCSLADLHIAPRPGSDGALALAMAYELINNHWLNQKFIDNSVFGYDAYAKLVQQYPPARVAAITGLREEEIRTLARAYGTTSPAAILLGYGLQRYTNSGQTIRAIDALAAISGNLGLAGGGVNYAGTHWKSVLTPLKGSELANCKRSLPWPTLSEAILDCTDPPVKSIFVTRSNPLTQLPDTQRVQEAFGQSAFTVCVDMFLTDTAEMSHLFLPCTSFLEDEDVVYNSWNHYLAYSHQVVQPLGQCRSDWQIFAGLAQFMGLAGFPDFTGEQWLTKALAPLAQYGITLETLKQGPIRHPVAPHVPWQDGRFPTPSGKYELYSQLAEADGVNPLPEYVEPRESPLRDSNLAQTYPLHLITAHHPDYLHSQFWNLSEKGQQLQPVFLHPDTAAAANIKEKQQVLVASLRGKAVFQAIYSSRLRRDTLLVYQGHWAKHGNGVNQLTPQFQPDMGLGTPYYDCLCRIEGL